MASMGQDDPFLEAQADLLATLNTTRSLFSSYLRIRSLAASASSPELAQARSELEANLHDLSSDLQDLIDSVKAVEGDPFRYGLDIDEVGRRRKLVEEVGGEVEDMREEVKSLANGQKRAGANASALPPPSAFDPDAPDGDDYEAFEQQRQVEIMQEQDEALDGVFKTVGNLRQQADDMGRELEEQQEMLEEVETLAERVGGKLQTGIKKVGWVIKKNEDPKLQLLRRPIGGEMPLLASPIATPLSGKHTIVAIPEATMDYVRTLLMHEIVLPRLGEHTRKCASMQLDYKCREDGRKSSKSSRPHHYWSFAPFYALHYAQWPQVLGGGE
ncbi:MAG: hypothetical protein LQ348_000458 [Seirophora lacunosa]|nr:MAG: hypothetical protein LQ348_000458 [Seirophora lacunosa]